MRWRCVCVFDCVDVLFMTCLPSVLAAASISAAVSGLLGHVWCRRVDLLWRLQQLTNSDVVSHRSLTTHTTLHDTLFIQQKSTVSVNGDTFQLDGYCSCRLLLKSLFF